jgi:O-antigen ligase
MHSGDTLSDSFVSSATPWLVALLLALSILSPSIRFLEGLPAIRLEGIVALVAFGLFLLRHLTMNHRIKLRSNPAYKWFALFGVSILCSIAYAAVVKGYYPIGRDFWELGKLLEYFLIFALVSSLRISSVNFARYYWIALGLFLLSVLFGFAQYFNLGDINAVVSPYYAPTQMYGLLVHGRIMGTTSNPNEFGALLVLASSMALSGALFFQRRLSRFASWLCLAVFILALMYTLSRSSLVALAIAIVVILTLYMATGMSAPKLRRLLLAIMLLGVIGVVDMQLVPGKFSPRVSQLTDISQANSWQGRLDKWTSNIAAWRQSPLFGWGPGKATMPTVVDSEWLLLLRRYGLIGVMVFIMWFASYFLELGRISRSSLMPEVMALTTALQATAVAYAAYMIPAAIYHSLQLMPIVLVLLGLAYSQRDEASAIEHLGSQV